MSFPVRVVIVGLLTLLLPLQASLAYARALAMTTGNAAGMMAKPLASSRVSVTIPPHAHHSGADEDPAVRAKPTSLSAGHHDSHHQSAAKSGNACDNCAKCCLAGAVAPPLIWPQSAIIVAARAVYASTSDTLSCFIPDGPERPPRCL